MIVGLVILHPPGLSPLTQGNLERLVDLCVQHGPIPAHAGEPLHGTLQLTTAWAYPRSRGGTSNSLPSLMPGVGLSPLTRGNLALGCRGAGGGGPIPAHAGEPSTLRI